MNNKSKLYEQSALFSADLEKVTNQQELESIRVKYLGKNGMIPALFAELRSFEGEAKKQYGLEVNHFRDEVSSQIQTLAAALENQKMEAQLASESVDVTLPPRNSMVRGKRHPLLEAIQQLHNIARDLGFTFVEAPEIETDWYNFGALNVPPLHPARQMQDTFYIKADADGAEQKPIHSTNGEELLRTHTSNAQIRYMAQHGAPCQCFSIGRVYRCDSDATHTPMFHQMELLYVGEAVNMRHLKWCLEQLLAAFFEVSKAPIRFRPSYFPFVEPGLEVDVQCDRSKEGMVDIGKGNDWLEILGCGMVHPAVLQNCNIDPHKYQGFAAGLGIERLAMLKYGISDLRDMFAGDMQWVNHFGL